jgi:hypothetical protein
VQASFCELSSALQRVEGRLWLMPTFWWNEKRNRTAVTTEFFSALHEPVIVLELSGGKSSPSICMTALGGAAGCRDGQQFLHAALSVNSKNKLATSRTLADAYSCANVITGTSQPA